MYKQKEEQYRPDQSARKPAVSGNTPCVPRSPNKKQRAYETEFDNEDSNSSTLFGFVLLFGLLVSLSGFNNSASRVGSATGINNSATPLPTSHTSSITVN